MSERTAAYQAAGWALCAIPKGQKGPITEGWNERGIDIVPEGMNVGLLHALSGTAALDIDCLPLAAEWFLERGVDLQAMLADPDNVQIVSGREGSAKLLFALPFPLPSKRVIVTRSRIRTMAFELRCASADGKSVQDVLPPSVHPSGTTYEWRGDWRKLPLLPEKILDIWTTLLAGEKVESARSAVRNDIPLEQLPELLATLDPDMDRDGWIRVGMGCKHEFGNDAYPAWLAWSRTGRKFGGERECVSQWHSFSNDKPAKVTFGTVVNMATEAGWKRPPPDISGLFGAVRAEPMTKKEVEAKMSPPNAVPPFDPDHWPKQLLKRASEVADEVGCDTVVPLLAGLAAVSAAADKQISLRLTPTWAVPPIIWTMTIGEPSDKKTPGAKPMFYPLRKIEAEDKPRYEAAMMGWIGNEARYAAQSKAYRDWAASPEAALPNAVPPAVDPLPMKPEPLRFVINDATSQKVVSMSQSRPRGFLLHLDEMNGWLRRVNSPTSTDDRSCWIHAFEGGPYTMDRVGAGTIACDNLASSIFGNCQPEVFRTHVKEGSVDGMLQRFLPVILDGSKTRLWKERNPAFMSSEADYEQLLRRVFSLPKFEYILSPDGMVEFRAFCSWVLKFRDIERTLATSAPYLTALGKLEGTCARIALLFHLINDPYCPFLSAETVRQAVDVMHRFFVPMLSHAFLEVAQERDMLSKAVFETVLQFSSVRPTILLAQLRAATKSAHGKHEGRKVDDLLRIAMHELATMNYVMMHQDHPRNPEWAINPQLAAMFPNDRNDIIRRKQERVETLRLAVRSATKGEHVARIGDAVGFMAA